MTILNKKESLILFLGDLASFLVALWLMLFLRYAQVPTFDKILQHLFPFSFLFIVWLLVFFIAGLYEKHAILLKSKLLETLLNAQIANSLIAVLFFYFIPYFGIAPKTNLFVDLVISFLLILAWRMYLYPRIGEQKKENTLLIGSGEEVEELKNEVNNNPRYGLYLFSTMNVDDIDTINFSQIQAVAADFHNEKIEPLLPSLYKLIFSNVRFVDMHRMYEDIFDRVPLSLLKYDWFLENISITATSMYDVLKRIMDIVISIPLLLVPIFCYPFIYIAMKIEDGGPVFIHQERIGKNKQPIRIIKYRSMLFDDGGTGRVKENKGTKVGSFLRKTRLDEFPQLWNVLRGDLSLIGPRPELPSLVTVYEKEIPYYNIRHVIQPGLSGWAQLYHKNPPKVNADYNETKNKLSYDLYYIKNRSFLLDLTIALKTIKALLSRSGI